MKLFCFNLQENMNNILAIKYYKPSEVVIFLDEDNEKVLDSTFTDYLNEENIHYTTETYRLSELKSWYHINKNQMSKNILVIPANGSYVGYQLLLMTKELDIQLIMVEADGDIYKLVDGAFEFETDYSDVDVDDFIRIRGGIVTHESTDLFDKRIVTELNDYLIMNYKAYLDLFRYSKHTNDIIHTYDYNPREITLYLRKLKGKKREFAERLVEFLKSRGIVFIKKNERGKLTLIFKDLELKVYLLKTGTWLEHKLYRLLKSMHLDDVRGSMSFIWNKQGEANNELDVLAVYENTLIMASCKDTAYIKPEQINEIYSVTTHMSNKKAVKLLFTTANLSESIKDKAKEFDIKLIKYNFNDEQTKEDLKKIL